ncbi:MAG: caspase family protein, partial [Armatimonadetes bacterium]|nr:caspase family protein [Armatimonadota bacterium]
MRRLCCLSVLVLAGFVCAGAPGAENAARSVAVRALETERGGPIYGTSWALVIGINRYPAGGPLRSLNFAVKDAEEVRALLVDDYAFPAGNVTLLLDDAATKQAILDGLTDLADKAGPDDRILFYFSGHGHTVDLPQGGSRGYLVPADAQIARSDLGNAARAQRWCVPMTDLRANALIMKARHKLFLIDACYSGLAISGRAPDSVPYHLRNTAFRPMLGIIAAGQAGQEALEDPALGHGAFTKKLLDALRPVAGTLGADSQPAGGDGVVTVQELAAYLGTNVPIVTGGRQTPVADLDREQNEGQMLFFPVGEETPAPAPPPLVVEQEKPPATTAALDVSSDPEGAEVVIGGAVVGTTNCRVTLPAAAGPTPYQIELRKAGYLPARLKVT